MPGLQGWGEKGLQATEGERVTLGKGPRLGTVIYTGWQGDVGGQMLKQPSWRTALRLVSLVSQMLEGRDCPALREKRKREKDSFKKEL